MEHRRRILIGTLLCAGVACRSTGPTSTTASAPNTTQAGTATGGGGLNPDEAQKSFRLPEGFAIELFAAEPYVVDPVLVAFDEDARAYVAEMADYPFGPPSGRIRLLQDRDGDGRADSSTVFAENVPTPMGLLPWQGGILVAAAPDILFLKDENGDGRADVRRVVFSGFAEGNQQHRVSTLTMGLDNWIYGSNGGNGAQVFRGGESESSAVSIRGADFRFAPNLHDIEPTTGSSQFGTTFDDWGTRFTAKNSQHVIHPVLPRHYLARNPALEVTEVTHDIPDHGAAGKVFPLTSLGERFNDPDRAGYFTSACGLGVYRATAFPAPFRGNIFVAEPAHSLVHRDVVSDQGTTFTAKRGESDAEFLASTDSWFRPVSVTTGPDGALYVVDFYRAVIEHPQWIPLDVQRTLDLRAGEKQGRIWRITHNTIRPARPHQLGKATAAQLVAALTSENGAVRETGQRLLVERQKFHAQAIPLLQELVRKGEPLPRVHALWTLQGIGALSGDLIEMALQDPAPGVRTNALRLAEHHLKNTPTLATAIARAATDDDAKVRLQAAFTLGELDPEIALQPLARLAVRDGADPWILPAILSSVKGSPNRLLATLAGDAPEFLAQPAPGATRLVRQLARMLAVEAQTRAKEGAPGVEGDLETWLRLVGGKTADRWRVVALGGLWANMPADPGRETNALLEKTAGRTRLQAAVQKWIPSLLAGATDPGRPADERADAITLLAWRRPPGAAARLQNLLNPQEPDAVQVAVVRALASWPGQSKRLLAGWSGYTARVRQDLLRSMFADRSRLAALIAKLEKGEIAVLELDPGQKQKLVEVSDPALKGRIDTLLAATPTAELEKTAGTIADRVLPMQGDPAAGQMLFRNLCAPCHRLHGNGYSLGPGLETVLTREPRSLVMDIVNPNRAMNPAYQAYTIKTAAEELTGIIAAETSSSITLRRPLGDQVTVLRADVQAMQALPASMMPEGFDQGMTDQNWADLLALLRKHGP